MVEVISIRDARPEDLTSLVEISIASRTRAYAHVFPKDSSTAPTEEAELLRFQKEWLNEVPQPVMKVALLGQIIIAYVVYSNVSAPELLELHCRPDHWGSGAGYALFEEARHDLIKPFTLYCLEDNPRARHFYERQGGVLTGETVEVFGQTDVQYRFDR